ncbi:hypothetical protein GGX14DRAFT_340090, partial [Mycena pura]
QLADILGVSRPTLMKHFKAHGVLHKFTNLSRTELDALVNHFREKKPNSGLRYLIGFLRKHGLRVQKCR